MAQTKIIKRRIKAAKNISQITRAMQMVSAAKMKKAQDLALMNRNYAQKLFEITRNLIAKRAAQSEINIYELYVVITPDKGLCGSLNTNLSRKILEIIKTEKEAARFVTIGKKGEQVVARYAGPLLSASFDFGIGQPKYEQVVSVAHHILNEFNKGKVGRVLVLYTDFVNTLVQKPVVKQILPIKNEDAILEVPEIEYLFEPDKNTILNQLIPYYVENQLFQLVLEAYASEQSARMMAMKNATDNAAEIMKELTLMYNRERQMQITNEIADITTAKMVI